MFLLGGIWTPHMFVCPHTFVYPWGFRHPHMSPILLSAPVCSERHLHVVGVVGGPLYVGLLLYMLDTSPDGGCLPICLNPPLIGWIPCACVCFRVYLHVIWGIPSMLVVWGEFPYMLGVQGNQHLCQALMSGSTSIGCPFCFILYLSCSSLCLTYLTTATTYYSSGYGSVFWYVIYFVSDHGPFLVGLSATLGQYEVVLSPPLMPRCPGGVTGLASVPQQQPPSLMPLLAYANYATGSPTGRFIFQS